MRVLVLETGETIAKLRSLKEKLQTLRDTSQVLLFRYVRDKDFPLEERFQVWVDFCDKKNHDRLDTGEVSPIGDWVEAGVESGWLNRGADYNWSFFLDSLTDHLDDVEAGRSTSPEFDIPQKPTIDKFKEILIAENFGSMCYDW